MVPLATLSASPYDLLQGDSIWAKLTATNSYGTSLVSEVGNGDVMVVVPDAPLLLRDNVDVTTAYVMGMLWTDGTNDGGKPVIDYVVSSDQSTGVWVDYASGILTQSYQTDFSVTYGNTYLFKVRARNSVGLSDYSAEVAILCA